MKQNNGCATGLIIFFLIWTLLAVIDNNDRISAIQKSMLSKNDFYNEYEAMENMRDDLDPEWFGPPSKQ